MATDNRQTRRGLHTGSKAWRIIRGLVLDRDRYKCKACGKFGDQVDHIDNDSHNNDIGNLQTLCLACHSSKTSAEQAGRAWTVKGCDVNGTPFGGHWSN